MNSCLETERNLSESHCRTIISISLSRNKNKLCAVSIYKYSNNKIITNQFLDSYFFPILSQQVEIHKPNVIIISNGQNHLLNFLKYSFKNEIEIIEVPRKWFDPDIENKDLNIEACDDKYFINGTTSAILKYIDKPNSEITIESQKLNDRMFMSQRTIVDLELFSENSSRKSLFSIIKNTKTKMGERLLRQNLLQPFTELDFILKRHEMIRFYENNPDTALYIEKMIENICDLDLVVENISMFCETKSFKDMKDSIVFCLKIVVLISNLFEFKKNIPGIIHKYYNDEDIDKQLKKYEDNSNEINLPISVNKNSILNHSTELKQDKKKFKLSEAVDDRVSESDNNIPDELIEKAIDQKKYKAKKQNDITGNKNKLFKKLGSLLDDTKITEIKIIIENYFDDFKTINYSKSDNKSQIANLVREGIDEYLDVSRKIHSENMDDLEDIFLEFKENFKYDLTLFNDENFGFLYKASKKDFQNFKKNLADVEKESMKKSEPIKTRKSTLIHSVNKSYKSIKGNHNKTKDSALAETIYSKNTSSEDFFSNESRFIGELKDKPDKEANSKTYKSFSEIYPNYSDKLIYNSRLFDSIAENSLILSNTYDQELFDNSYSFKKSPNLIQNKNKNKNGNETLENNVKDIYNENSKVSYITDINIIFERRCNVYFSTTQLVRINLRINDSYEQIIQLESKYCKEVLIKMVKFTEFLQYISEEIAELDVTLSFFIFSRKVDCCLPEFGERIAINNTHNLFVEKKNQIENNIYSSSQLNFNIVTGANMSGKTTYIKHIAHCVILAQIGCPVNAKCCEIKIFKNILTLLSHIDMIEKNMSTFEVEISDIKTILNFSDDKSLVLIDELGRGTNYIDGISVAVTTCKQLLSKKSFVYFITHFTEVINFVKGSSNLNVIQSNKFKVSSGVSECKSAIELCKNYFPANIIIEAEKIRESLSKILKENVTFENRAVQLALKILECKGKDEEKNLRKYIIKK